MADGFTEFPIFLISFVAGAAVVASLFISKLVRRVSVSGVSITHALEQTKIAGSLSNVSKKSHQSHINKSNNNKKKHGDKSGRDEKQPFNHQFLLVSLKGHTTNVLDMEFSPNGKYLATCGEGEGDGSGNSSSSEGNKENAVVGTRASLSRRQKKNRVRKEDDSPVSKKMTRKTCKRAEGSAAKKPWTPFSWQYFKMNLDESELYAILKHYTLTPDQMMELGYPVESSLYPGRAIIYKCGPPVDASDQCRWRTRPPPPQTFDVNAREFVPSCYARKNYSEMVSGCNVDHSREGSKSGDSDAGEDKDSDKEVTQTEQIKQRILKRYQTGSEEKYCVRCGRGFFVMHDGEYLTQEKCVYHWGKLHKVSYPSNGSIVTKEEFACCKRKKNSKGCSTGKLHVWSGVAEGVNGPLDGYVKTKPRDATAPGVYSIDCEMCFTTQGLELGKITIVAVNGHTVYDSYVKPENPIIDYNTRFSGITAKDLEKAKSLREVQSEVTAFVSADTILIGHSLESDLKALKMIHPTVIDTAVTFPHIHGLPYRRSLRAVVNSYLRRDIQVCGHDSFEDARACMELMLWRVKKDFITSFDHKNYALKNSK